MGDLSAQSGTVLDRIVAARREAVEAARRTTPEAVLRERVAAAPPVRDFRKALTGPGINIIAECKKASPSAGLLQPDYNPAKLAPVYEEGGACALSVLTEPEFFDGALEDLTVARQVTELPVLRKDFIFDAYQLLEARAAGADAFLLIVAILSEGELGALIEQGRELGMTALVEVHTEEGLGIAVRQGAQVIGVNNRDLKTLEVNLETSFVLAEKIPEPCLAVSESGIETRRDIDRLRAAGFHTFLVGAHLMRADDPGAALRALTGAGRRP